MPIQLDNLAATTTSVKSLNPKFFSSKLTGAGKKTGLISESVRPNNVSLTQTLNVVNNAIDRKTKQVNGDVTTNFIPLAPMLQRSLDRNKHVTHAIPDYDEMYQVHTQPGNPEIWVDLTPQALVLREDASPAHGTIRDLLIQYRIEIYTVIDRNQPRAAVSSHGVHRSGQNQVSFLWTFNTPNDLHKAIQNHLPTSAKFNSVGVDMWMEDYDVHDRICRLANLWASDELAQEMGQHIADLGASSYTDTELNNLAAQLRYLETYGVSLGAYKQLHVAIHGAFPADVANQLSKQNLNLLMNSTLDNLDTMKAQLSTPPKPSNGAQVALQSRFSAQQKQAVSTDEPLVLVQAGAGTGKSTVILGRIDYLVSCGVTPADITVLSFTNAAADNISAKNPSIGSMTIARMIHDIYEANYKGHELSSIDTIINSLDIFYPQDDVAARFRRHLMRIHKNEEGAFTGMNSFIEANFDAVMNMLTTLRQTSLELEIIICYQKIDEMVEPAHVMSRYLIIDEVQDNSIFEFIFMLKYVAKHSESLYIVGDGSQTLYEFRSSNPKALNALESSGVFATFKLTTNYRSNQEVLDFANVALADIEANQFAGIQLQANNLTLPTAASFQEKVTLDYRCYPRVTEFPKDLPGIITHSVREYIEGCFKRGEQVSFLMFTRAEVALVEKTLKDFWPSRTVANLVPAKTYATTVFSLFIRNYWGSVKQVPPADAAFTVTQEIIKNLHNISRNAAKAEPQVREMISNWWIEVNATVLGWVALYGAGQMTKNVFFDNLRQCLLDYEIRHNAVKQSITSQRNKDAKERNLGVKTDFVISTIHSAKGLEFDNVVVIHRFDSQMEEANKRMYYVAFTRAMNTEYVLSYGTLKNARIESDYNLLVQALEERDAANALRSMSTGDDDEEIFDDGSIDDAVVLSDELPEPPARYDASDDDDASHISGVVTG